ncbi:Phosphatase 1 regulatory subunit SDS22 [Fulvia fulva]|uniref:Phosphatase 1 regulatory subunit SDS22 n=1 Tax=Passalora fulva TaxID=5499 RepID=A0A9Q8LJ66_PASFU|nr:Phosphatase 1 regulatory subunit SDS22 [Fulvia fulva]KAK4624053.1 Phosphatase 1 regulatory subunit SDS22 [Fulvia fulva]KAK4625404.1 Phosphatase 1 regulatory subunit SDS22 [Fulvia fulva]UJO18355.1 Phosphatase 1 regulatory subunit SDS22 [Fulvia fulva]WPV15468.1 Phosphatase 1 regulatory subunit SDS22 [Fulvia fulva]WPV30151.1 Phosphatase 1 regulatory subunit SDS22 [Fulvia fulva]
MADQQNGTSGHPPPLQNGTNASTNGTHATARSASGRDGKLRVNKQDKQATLANPEALEDSDYSDEDAPPPDQIAADEDLLEGVDPEEEDIELLHSKITSIPALRLERYKNIKRLCLRQNQIQRIELPESSRPQLEELELYDNLIKHIDGVEDCTALTQLDLSYNKIKHIKHLAKLTKLDHLYFVQNRISKIEGLEELTQLTYLELGANRIKEIDGIETLTKLESLWLGQNKITELKGLSTLSNLRSLSIQANRLTSLNGIESIPQITELYVSDNKITSLEPLRHNTKLEMLDFQSNPISSLAGLEDLKELENVWASNCQVDSFQEIERALKDKEKLDEVYFEGNPVQRQNPVLYRNKVRLALPQVTKIDAAYVKQT